MRTRPTVANMPPARRGAKGERGRNEFQRGRGPERTRGDRAARASAQRQIQDLERRHEQAFRRKESLDSEHAALLAKQTVLGSATMAKTSTDTPAELRRKVTSPNGTTQAAIESMDMAGVGISIRTAIDAACKRSIELREASAR